MLEEGAYRDVDLSLARLAGSLGVHPNRLSAVINDAFGESFPSLVCRYRVEYFTRRVDEGALREQSILDLALEAGFPSKSTFNRVFKDHLGMSPSAYASDRRGTDCG